MARCGRPDHLQRMSNLDGDVIRVEQLEVSARVGVPEIERATSQRLLISLTIWPLNQLEELQDDMAQTVDYAALAKSVRAFVAERCDKLIETLASALATHLLDHFAIRAIQLELRKFVIPGCDHVAVIITRARSAEANSG